MSAPEPQVRVVMTVRYSYDVVCSDCGPVAFGYIYEGWAERCAEKHRREDHALARLQARWNARDEVLRALIERWRAEAVIVRTDEADGERYRSVVTVGLDTLADELERAIGGGR